LTDVLSSEVELVRLGNGIQIRIQPKGSSGLETINITNQIASSKAGYGIEELEFSDGKVWDLEDIFANTRTLGTNASETLAGSNRAGDNIYGLGGNDTLIGHDQGDHLYGGTGNDELYGKNGDDTLEGGIGTDYLNGSSGNDTYVWSRGDGNDTLYDTSKSLTEIDRLTLTDVLSSEVELVRLGNGIQIRIQPKGSSGLETINITNQIASSKAGYGIEELEFSDGKVWDLEDIFANTRTLGTNASETLAGSNRAGDNIYGLGGNDTLIGHDQGDHLYGGTGNDELYGKNGDDTLNGGSGADYLNGGSGSDVYVFDNLLIGHDRVYDFTTGAASEDIIRFDTDVFSDMESVLAATDNVGTNAVIKIDDNNSITLLGVSQSDLHADDFQFV
jgi:Ca2+-binding RTX toxin-like protein